MATAIWTCNQGETARLSTTVTTMEYVHTGGGYSVSVKSVWVCVCMHIFLGEHIGACLYKLPQND